MEKLPTIAYWITSNSVFWQKERWFFTMNLETKLFGTVGVSEEKKIHFPGGIIGFPDLKDFILIHDEEVEENNKISKTDL